MHRLANQSVMSMSGQVMCCSWNIATIQSRMATLLVMLQMCKLQYLNGVRIKIVHYSPVLQLQVGLVICWRASSQQVKMCKQRQLRPWVSFVVICSTASACLTQVQRCKQSVTSSLTASSDKQARHLLSQIRDLSHQEAGMQSYRKGMVFPTLTLPLNMLRQTC